MYLSKFFLPVLKENPSEAKIKSHILMLRSGMIKQSSAGIYSWLPLGIKVIRNIEKIIKKRMEEVNIPEMLMPCIQNGELWKQSGRYDAYGPEMLKIKDRHNNDLLFSPTNEELFTEIIKPFVKSYKALPLAMYQIQWKFRDEIRPRFGVMRGREFFMKDGYSLDVDKDSAIDTYNKVFKAYIKIFEDMDLNVIPVKGDPGPIGGNLNHEFQIVAETGEGEIFYDKKFDDIDKKNLDIYSLDKIYAAAEDVHDEKTCGVNSTDLICKRAIEVGHIFYFGTKYSEVLGANINNKEGKLSPIHMGSYGIGVSRLVGAIIEANHDDKGIIWPKNVAPFNVSIIYLLKDEDTKSKLDNFYKNLSSVGIDVLFDDSDDRAGAKFATHDLIGSTFQIIAGRKFLESGIVEFKNRKTSEVIEITLDSAFDKLKEYFIDE